jgi:hypothetical protein
MIGRRRKYDRKGSLYYCAHYLHCTFTRCVLHTAHCTAMHTAHATCKLFLSMYLQFSNSTSSALFTFVQSNQLARQQCNRAAMKPHQYILCVSSHLTSHLISSHLISSHLNSSHRFYHFLQQPSRHSLPLSHHIKDCIISDNIISYNIAVSDNIISDNLSISLHHIRCNITYHITSYRITHIQTTSYQITSYQISWALTCPHPQPPSAPLITPRLAFARP